MTDNQQLNLFLQQRSMIERCIIAEEFSRAKTQASAYLTQAKLFVDHWNYGNAIHHGNMYLGFCAFQEHNIEEAKRYLLASGTTPGSPQLQSFGPNMLLANKLLGAQEREVVIEFLGSCNAWWGKELSKTKLWINMIREGVIPNFGANLFY